MISGSFANIAVATKTMDAINKALQANASTSVFVATGVIEK